jgi:hypothetical protein
MKPIQTIYGTRGCLTHMTPPNPQPDHHNKKQANLQAKFEAAVLVRRADTEGWSEEKLTMALSGAATTKNKPSLEGTSTTTTPAEQAASSLQKREETLRTIRQAENEGWSDEKLVAALRIRLELRDELRVRAQTL